MPADRPQNAQKSSKFSNFARENLGVGIADVIIIYIEFITLQFYQIMAIQQGQNVRDFDILMFFRARLTFSVREHPAWPFFDQL